MDPEPKMIRRDIERTRSALTEKLETLESEVLGTVQGARNAVTETVEAVKDTVANVKSSVQDTVDSVKDSIGDTVDSVKDALNVKRQTRRHPWPMFGASVAAGLLAGTYLPAPRTIGRRLAKAASPGPSTIAYQDRLASETRPAPSRPSFFTRLAEQFGPELQQLKGLAIGTALGMIRDSLHGALPPSLEPHVQEILHNVTRKIGGEEIEGPILSSEQMGESESPEFRRRF